MEGFSIAFSPEENNLRGENRRWALSPTARIYFGASLNGVRYLLVGINPSPTPAAINISSFARVVTEPKGYAAACLKRLIEDRLVPMCHNMGKEMIVVQTINKRSERVLARLAADRPKGIKEIKKTSEGKVLFVTQVERKR